MRLVFFLAAYIAVIPLTGAAQHPIEVQRFAAKKDFLSALTTYGKMSSRKITPAAAVAAGKSAWALGLPQIALKEFDRALLLSDVSGGLTHAEKSRVLFSQSIIEFQEGEYAASAVQAQKALELINEDGPLKGQILMLLGDALFFLEQYKNAEEKYESSAKMINSENDGDLYYSLGRCQLRMGKLQESKHSFQQIPLHHEKSPAAIRALAQIAFESNKFEEVVFWLRKGREEYKDSFLDSWVDYALARSFIALNEFEEARKVGEFAENRYPPSDSWYVLLEAMLEAFEWDQGNKETEEISG
ncbi:MAG: tetratricopeptide repeat protein [Deltaproteobacteria bacterium]|nr:tetratricopeptide repeat protein [Deltaproteobacteria bacterium]